MISDARKIEEMMSAIGVLILVRDMAKDRGIDVVLEEIKEAVKEHPGSPPAYVSTYGERAKSAWKSLLHIAADFSRAEAERRVHSDSKG